MEILKIVGGPSKADLIWAFARAFDQTEETVTFELEDGKKVEVQVTALQYESGAPHMLLVYGNIKNESGLPPGLLKSIFFQSDNRTGILEMR